MRRWVWRALLLVAVMAALTVGAAAAETAGLVWAQEGDEWTVTGYTGTNKEVTIPARHEGGLVTKIKENAFLAKDITSVEIPGTVKTIEKQAFMSCGSLTKVNFRDSALDGVAAGNTQISENAFMNCAKLNTLNLSGSVGSIDKNAFVGCTALMELVVPDNVASIGPGAFADCTGLAKVAISGENSPITVEADAFTPTTKLKVLHVQGTVTIRNDDPDPEKRVWKDEALHKAVIVITTTAPTCTSKGSVFRTVACTAPGKTSSTCDFKFGGKPQEIISELPHDFRPPADYAQETHPDCESWRETYEGTCAMCGAKKTISVYHPATKQHDFSGDPVKEEETKQATCIENGTKTITKKCRNTGCDQTQVTTEVIPKDPNAHVQAVERRVLVPSTCAKAGWEAQYGFCQNCKKLTPCQDWDHDALDEEANKTLLEKGEFVTGYKEHLKSIHDLTELPLAEHTWGEKAYDYKEETDKPTCKKKGTLTAARVCTVCGEKEWDTSDTQGADMTDHTPPDTWKEEILVEGDCETPSKTKYPEYKCEVCGDTIPERIEEGTATGKHTWVEDKDHPEKVTKEATCKEEGQMLTAGQKCTVCGKTLPQETKSIPRKAHTWENPKADPDPKDENGNSVKDKAPTCGKEGVSHVIITCSVCNETEHRKIELPATRQHTWGEWKTEGNQETRTCSVCGEKDTRPLSSSDPTDPDNPGDPSNPGTPSEPEQPKTYPITLVQGAGGTASINRTTAQEGDRITVTLSPNSGYELDMIRAIGGGTDVLTLTDLGGGQHRFTMPAASVEIRVTFERRSSGASGSNWASAPGDSSSSGDARRTSDVMPTQNAAMSTPQAWATEQRFQDIPMGHWAAGEIEWVNRMGYMNGTGGRFNPDGNISQQQMWMVLARLTGSNPANMAEARRWAAEHSFADGSSPTGPVARHQLVTALYRSAHLMGRANQNTTSLAGYPDSRTVPTVARNAFSWALANGIISGTSNGRLDPNGTLTRAQFAVILYRYSQRA